MNILFDIDDTLYDQKDVFLKAWRTVFNVCDEALTEKIFQRSRALSGKAFLAIKNGELSADEMYVYRITEAMSENGICVSKAQAEAFQTAYLQAQGEIQLSGMMKAILTALKTKQVRIGILSNGGTAFQQKKIADLGLTVWFAPEDIFISEAIGYEKPDDRAYEYVLDRWGVKAEDVIFVGDAYDHDIVGAASAGLQTVWMNRRNNPMPEGQLFLPDATAHSEEELADILDSMLK